MFAESIPAGILQMYVYVQSSNRSMAAAGSILVSALTTGFASALASYGKVVGVRHLKVAGKCRLTSSR